MQYWNAAQLLLGLGIIALGIFINIARHKTGVREWIEKYILGSDSKLFDETAEYAPMVKFAGWKSLATGLAIAIPLPIIWDTVLLVGGIAVLTWLVFRVKREYRKYADELAEEQVKSA